MQTSIYLIANQSVELPDPNPCGAGWFSAKLWTDQVLGIIKSLNKPPETILNMFAEVKRGYYKVISFHVVQHCFVNKAIYLDKMVNPALLESQAARVFNKLFRPLNNPLFYDSDFKLLHETNSLEVWQPWSNKDIDAEFDAASIVTLNKFDISWSIHNLKMMQYELNTVRDSLMEHGSVARRAA